MNLIVVKDSFVIGKMMISIKRMVSGYLLNLILLTTALKKSGEKSIGKKDNGFIDSYNKEYIYCNTYMDMLYSC